MAYTLVNNCDSLTDWTESNCTLSIDTSDKQEGTGSLKVVSTSTFGKGQYNPAGTWDFSQKRHISVWVKGDSSPGTGNLWLYNGADYEYWSFTHPNDWTLMKFDLDSPTGTGGNGLGDKSVVNYLRIGINASGKTARYDFIRVDNVEEFSETFSTVDSLVKNATEQLAETLSAIDSKATKIVKALAETFLVIDSFISRLALGESFGIIDSIIKTGNKAKAESFNIIDSWKAKLSFNEIFSIVDSLTNSASLAKLEAFSIIDSWSSRIRLSEAFSTIDSFARTISYYFAEALGIVDTYKTGIVWVEEIKKTIDWILADDTGWFTGWFSGWFSGEASWIEEVKKTINWTKE